MRFLLILLLVVLGLVACSAIIPTETKPETDPKPELVVADSYDGKYAYIIDSTNPDFRVGFYTKLELKENSNGYTGTLTYGQDTGLSPLTLNCGSLESSDNLECTSTSEDKSIEFSGKISGTTKYSGTFSDSVGIEFFTAQLTMGTFEFTTNNFKVNDNPNDSEVEIIGIYKGQTETNSSNGSSSFSSQPGQFNITSVNGNYEAQFTETEISSTLSCRKSNLTLICEGEYGAGGVIIFSGKITKTSYSGSIEHIESDFITNTGKFEYTRQ